MYILRHLLVLALLMSGPLFAEPEEINAAEPMLADLAKAQGLEDQGELDQAIGAYARIWATRTGAIVVSAPAMERWMKISWERNNPGEAKIMSDREGVLEAGRKYLEMTGRFEEKMNDADHRLWLRVKDLVEELEAELKKG